LKALLVGDIQSAKSSEDDNYEIEYYHKKREKGFRK
jgi:hypothetical protein